MTGNLTSPLFNGNINGATGYFSHNSTAAKFCTGTNCRAISELALSNQACPNSQAQIGVDANGIIICKPLKCPANQFFAGLDASNNAVCRPYPTKTCPTNQYVSEVNADGSVTCAVLPNNANSTCPAGQVIQSISAGIPTCVNKGAGTSCSAGQVVTAISSDGTITCSPSGAGKLVVPTVGESSACIASEGNIAVNSGGELLSCQSGFWKKNQATIPSGTICGSRLIGIYGEVIPCQGHSPDSSCPPGYSKAHLWHIGDMGSGDSGSRYVCVKN